ncbi:hypothetical protein L1987_56437 [Smallanthus sonchifolius]|uniref:Uncharacterized protein n=1 Tax=Smallanthus sonchifolius TaxID=185202 RepID=A0ACB9ECP1_9ASTR|nr:hypothetical protein L1987_56437 [Smallanthus sonchifolius]
MDQEHQIKRNQRFNDLNASYEDKQMIIPGPLDSKHHAANHAKQIECMNRDTSSTSVHRCENRVTCDRVIFLLVMTVILVPLWVHLTATNTPYSLVKDDEFVMPMKIDGYGIEFYVRSRDGFDKKYPVGSLSRVRIEDDIITGYIQMLQRDCSHQLWWESLSSENPTPAPDCNKLLRLGIHI